MLVVLNIRVRWYGRAGIVRKWLEEVHIGSKAHHASGMDCTAPSSPSFPTGFT